MTGRKRGRPRLYANPSRPVPSTNNSKSTFASSSSDMPSHTNQSVSSGLNSPGLSSTIYNNGAQVDPAGYLQTPAAHGYNSTTGDPTQRLNYTSSSQLQQRHLQHSLNASVQPLTDNPVDRLTRRISDSSRPGDSAIAVLPSPNLSDDMQDTSSTQNRPLEIPSDFTRLQQLAAQYGGVAELEKHLAQSSATRAQSKSSTSTDMNANIAPGSFRTPSRNFVLPSQISNVNQPTQLSRAPLPSRRQYQRDHASEGTRIDFSTAKHAVQTHLAEVRLARRPGTVDEGRLKILVEACEEQDLVYLAMHQTFCSQSYLQMNNGTNPHLPQKELFLPVEQLILSNDQVSPALLAFFKDFPVEWEQVEHYHQYRGALSDDVPPLLYNLQKNFQKFKIHWSQIPSAPSVDNFGYDLGLEKCPCLQRVAFVFLIRSTWPKPYDRCRCLNEAEYAFRMNQNRESEWQRELQNDPNFPITIYRQKYYSDLDKIFRNIRIQHQQHGSIPSNVTQQGSLHRNYSTPGNNLGGSPRVVPVTSRSDGRTFTPTAGRVGNSSPQLSRTSGRRRSSHALTEPSMQSAQFLPPSRETSSVRSGGTVGTLAWPSRSLTDNSQSFIDSRNVGSGDHSINEPQNWAPTLAISHASRGNQPTNASHGSVGTQQLSQHNLLFPQRGQARPQLPNPPPDSYALHQSHLRDPILISFKYGDNSHCGNVNFWFSYLSCLLLQPLAIAGDNFHATGNFFISEQTYELIAQNWSDAFGAPDLRIVRPGSISFRIRCIKSTETLVTETTWAVAETAWPNSISVEVNNKPLEFRKKYLHGKDLPVDITSKVLQGLNHLKISVLQDQKELGTGGRFHVSVEMIEYSNHELIRKAVLDHSPVNTGSKIRDRLSSKDDDIEILSNDVTIRLMDPFTSQQVVTPVRGLSCTHYECFDLDVFLQTRHPCRPEKFKCPICGSDCRPQVLVLDKWFLSIIAELQKIEREDVGAIVVDGHARWKIKEELLEGESGDGDGKRPCLHGISTNMDSNAPSLEPEVIELD